MSRWLSTSYQPATWAQHALVSILVSVVFALFTGTGTTGLVIASWLTVVFFVVREEKHEDEHKEAGDWYTPDTDGVTPLVDKVGDLVGPITVATTFLVMWIFR